MTLTRLPWRIGLPFAAFVLAGSFAFILWMGWSLTLDERARFEDQARTNADFINRMNLPASERMAEQLAEVIRVSVFFRHNGHLIPEPPALIDARYLNEMPADKRCHRSGTIECVAVSLHSGHDLILARFAFGSWREVWNGRTLTVLGAFWFLSLIVARLVSRGLVLPLRHLAAKLPDIEKPEPMELPEALRKDEIGDVARAFVRTREALQGEREQRARAENLAALGRMTTALAHEIQNPVSAIKMHAQLWLGEEGNPARIIENEAARIESLINQWMFLSRPEAPAMSDVNIAQLLAEALSAHRSQMEHAQVKGECRSEETLIIKGDHRRLRQVFTNLIINAIQSMSCGGKLDIMAHRVGTAVEITFADTGKGFSEMALKHFAELFYSEKEGGMGIGLSVASEIIKAHGGELHARNRIEGGAYVTLKLPELRAEN